jgi:hypothetical protein
MKPLKAPLARICNPCALKDLTDLKLLKALKLFKAFKVLKIIKKTCVLKKIAAPLHFN